MSIFILLSSLLVAAAPLGSDCKPIAGWEQIMAKTQVRWIVLGEVHGNNESPDIFADAVCQTSRSRKVVVAVEQPSNDQQAIDRFIASDGGEAARRAFMQASIWNGPLKDGRSSEAYFRLFETLRQRRSAGHIESVIAFQPTHFTARPTQADYEKVMAELVIAAARPGTTVIALVGNLHAMRTKVPWGGYLPMAAHLPADEVVTLNLLGEGGDTWSCRGQPIACGTGSTSPSGKTRAAEVELMSGQEGPYSGVLYLGVPTTASPPQPGLLAKPD